MAGFLRRVAGAFVEMDDDPTALGADKTAARASRSDRGKGEGAGLDAISQDAAALLAQLEGHAPTEMVEMADGGRAAPDLPGGAAGSALVMSAEDVFAKAGIADGPNSAARLLKIIAGLKLFPPEQQVVMVRAIDQADETWSETRVLDDARTRQSALRTHLQGIEQERAARMGTLQERIAATRAEGKALCDDIDARIAELAGKREQAVVQTTHSVSELEAQMQRLEADTDQARRGITTAINALSSLLTFFKGEKPSG